MRKRRGSERIYKIAIIDAIRRGAAQEEPDRSSVSPERSDVVALKESKPEGNKT